MRGAYPKAAHGCNGLAHCQARAGSCGVLSLKLSEKDRQLLFAALVVAALGAAAYAFFLSTPEDKLSDGNEFYRLLSASGSAGFLYDVRGADQEQAQAIYQCGVDIISKGRLAGKALDNIACDETGCIAASTASNGTSRLTFEQAKRRLSSAPYIQIGPDAVSSYRFFQRHMEIYIGKNTGNATRCDISAIEG